MAITLICISTLAISVDSPGTVYLYDEAKEVSLKIVNQEDSAQDYSIEFDAPTRFELSKTTGTIAGNGRETVSIKLYPRSDLVGQTYKSKLEVNIGNERFVKQLRIVFRGAQEEQAEEPEPEVNGTETDLATSFFTLFALPAITAELLVNLVLMVVSAILLIAFIARFVKRMEGH
ncbi:MAG: hypothetical protein CL943_00355 [Candidatus Diapherotrites archaeon]|uniref:FixG C-terminal immunoglobulin-like domain-containing protein n=1 Tax=Candidatus Iainarchaeum sp. TaxID=3101447 RepID=A0A2D6LZZ0_9ARCH|nr:hypothetical protein [Candidatus Diapherotrites archaeon]